MKKIIIYMLFSLALFSGCKKNNDQLIDGEKPEQRIIDALNVYSTQLTGSTYGWKAYLYPKDGGGYSFYMNFNQKNRVTMYADMDDVAAATSLESSYLIKANQIPTLSFDTYSYLHKLADPAGIVPGSTVGWGLHSDFEFPFQTSNGDTLKLTGKLFSENQLIMVKATQAEQTAYNAKGLFNSRSSAIKYFTANPNLYLNFGDGVKVQTAFNYTVKAFSLVWADGGNVVSVTSPYVFTLNGILLQTPIFYKANKVSEILWDTAKSSFYVMVGGKRLDIVASPTPILPLQLLIGVNYSSITVPKANTYPGWSSDFAAKRTAAANKIFSSVVVGGVPVVLGQMAFQFNLAAKTMTINISTTFGTNSLPLSYGYDYTKTSAGVFKFNQGPLGGNESFVATYLSTLLADRINVDTFTLDYYVNPTTGETLGQFKSVEHPDFTFSGPLK